MITIKSAKEIETMAAAQPNVAAKSRYVRRRLEAQVVLHVEIRAVAAIGVETRVRLAVRDERADHDAGALAAFRGLRARGGRQQLCGEDDAREQAEACDGRFVHARH